MKNKSVSGECLECESVWEVEYVEEMVSDDYPSFCPFCGSEIDELSENVDEDEDTDEDKDNWE